MKFLLIVNPASGGGKNLVKLAKVLKYFRKKGDEVTVARTQGPGHARQIATDRCREDFDALIACGGDGTINEVIGGLAGTGTPLGILPWGTGNVFAKEMGLPTRVRSLCKVIRQGRSVRVDLGYANQEPFLLMASAGLDAYALGRTSARTKKVWGIGAYALAALGALARYTNPQITVTFPDGRRDQGSFVLVSNTRLYGSFFVFQPQANPADGLLDVFVFRDQGRWKFLGMAIQMFLHALVRRHSSRRAAFLDRHGVYQVKSMDLTCPQKLPLQADGEFLGPLPVHHKPTSIRVSEGALTVILPKRTTVRLTGLSGA